MYYDTHAQARTTAAMREQIKRAQGTTGELAQRFGVSEQTIRKWRRRESIHDRSHRPNQLQTTLNGSQENLAIGLRLALRLPLDDLLGLIRQFMQPKLSRSGLDRTLRRRGFSRLAGLRPPLSGVGVAPGKLLINAVPATAIGAVDSAPMMLIATDLASRWSYLGSVSDLGPPVLETFFDNLCELAPFSIAVVIGPDGTRFATGGLDRRSGGPSRSVANAMFAALPTWNHWGDCARWMGAGRAPSGEDLISINAAELAAGQEPDCADRIQSLKTLFERINSQARLPCLNLRSPLEFIAQAAASSQRSVT